MTKTNELHESIVQPARALPSLGLRLIEIILATDTPKCLRLGEVATPTAEWLLLRGQLVAKLADGFVGWLTGCRFWLVGWIAGFRVGLYKPRLIE